MSDPRQPWNAAIQDFKWLPGGRYVGYYRMAFTNRLIIGTAHDYYDNCWCYDLGPSIDVALFEWASRGYQGEPVGWHRHPPSGRRRPDGDPAQEYVNL